MTLEENKEATSKLSLPKNVHASPFFSGHGWVIVILMWAILAILFNGFENWSKYSSR
jgi:hypothetical protein